MKEPACSGPRRAQPLQVTPNFNSSPCDAITKKIQILVLGLVA
jgi:hypothetical protein